MKMNGKVAIVVGSTSGIGKAMAQVFAAAGATVIVTGRREEHGQKVVSEIEATGGKADFFKLDVRDLDAMPVFIQQVYEKYGRIDTFLYNAGIAPIAHLEDTTEETWDAVYNTNLKPSFFAMRKVLPILAKTKGSVILTGALSGFSAVNAGPAYAYATCKAAIDHLVRLLALEAAKSGVRVNSVAPGVTMTDILTGVPESTMNRLKSKIPLNMLAMPEDIAKAALFLASEDARFITGQTICVDGGASIG